MTNAYDKACGATQTSNPTAHESTTEHVVGRAKWTLLISLGVVFFALHVLYAAVMVVLLPNQIQDINAEGKIVALGTLFAITSIFSTIATPLAGALSDRTRSRFGRRTPWILLGAMIGGVAMLAIPHVSSMSAISGFWLVAVVALNSMQPAITTVVADRFVISERGLASGVVGGSMTAGISFGAFLGGKLAAHSTLAYTLVGVAIMAACAAFVILNPEPRVDRPPPPRFDAGGFIRSFWIDPRRHPDFAWAFLGRFTVYIGYNAVLAYLLYIIQDHVGLDRPHANDMIATMSLVTFVGLSISGLGAGYFSDLLGRRKPMVFVAGIVMAAAMLTLLVAPTIQGLMVYAALIGVGYGAFMSVDLALMTQVLPQRGDSDDATGKDLGILTTAVNVPQILSPVLAAGLLAQTGNNYSLLFAIAAAFVLVGSFFVLLIRAVR